MGPVRVQEEARQRSLRKVTSEDSAEASSLEHSSDDRHHSVRIRLQAMRKVKNDLLRALSEQVLLDGEVLGSGNLVHSFAKQNAVGLSLQLCHRGPAVRSAVDEPTFV